MSFLHSRNVLHGDLTGGNVLLTAAPRDPRTFQAKVGGCGGYVSVVGVPCHEIEGAGGGAGGVPAMALQHKAHRWFRYCC